jgi:hypothetical protein
MDEVQRPLARGTCSRARKDYGIDSGFSGPSNDSPVRQLSLEPRYGSDGALHRLPGNTGTAAWWWTPACALPFSYPTCDGRDHTTGCLVKLFG